jgi:hypothetical protein
MMGARGEMLLGIVWLGFTTKQQMDGWVEDV